MALQSVSIENCHFAFKCPRTWDHLEVTAAADQRHCSSCQQTVFLCLDEAALTGHVEAGHCVAVARLPDEPLSVGRIDSNYSTATRPSEVE